MHKTTKLYTITFTYEELLAMIDIVFKEIIETTTNPSEPPSILMTSYNKLLNPRTRYDYPKEDNES